MYKPVYYSMVKTVLLTLALSAFAVIGAPLYVSAGSSTVTFSITNQQPVPVGTVTVNTLAAGYNVTVTDVTTYSVDIDDNAVSVTINGQSLSNGQKGLVTLADGTVVGVMWTATNAIVIVDKDEIQ